MKKKMQSIFSFVSNYFIKTFIIVSFIIATGVLVMTFIFYVIDRALFLEAINDALKVYQNTLSQDFVSNSNSPTATINPIPTTTQNVLPSHQNSPFPSLSPSPSPVVISSKSSSAEISDGMMTIRMQYLENISEMHRKASSTDLFVFMYGFLSSVLIGISAYMVRKGKNQCDELTKKYLILESIAEDINIRFDKNENVALLSFISEVLLEAMISISSYSIMGRNENIVRFKQSIRQISLWLDNVNLTKVEQLALSKFTQRFGFIEGMYLNLANLPNFKIDDFHRKHIIEDFTRITEKLNEK